MTSSFALAKGSSLPILASGVLRFYDMRFCPFAQRTRLVLAHKNIPHEVVNVNLKFKPEWFLQRNPRGLVPVLEINDKIVYESAICDEYLEEMYPEPALLPKDPFLRAKARLVMDEFSKISSALNGLKSRKIEKKLKAFESLMEGLGYFEKLLKEDFFGGNSPSLVDYHMWPWFERMPAMKQMSGGMDPLADFPLLRAWTVRMENLDIVRKNRMSDELHLHFFKSFGTGHPAYDAGLVQANL